MMAPKLVMVEWEDSRRPDGDWRWLDAEHGWTVVRCQSVGWMVARRPVVVLAPNMGDVDDARQQMSGVIQIPARCVIRITPLSEIKASSAS